MGGASINGCEVYIHRVQLPPCPYKALFDQRRLAGVSLRERGIVHAQTHGNSGGSRDTRCSFFLLLARMEDDGVKDQGLDAVDRVLVNLAYYG